MRSKVPQLLIRKRNSIAGKRVTCPRVENLMREKLPVLCEFLLKTLCSTKMGGSDESGFPHLVRVVQMSERMYMRLYGPKQQCATRQARGSYNREKGNPRLLAVVNYWSKNLEFRKGV